MHPVDCPLFHLAVIDSEGGRILLQKVGSYLVLPLIRHNIRSRVPIGLQSFVACIGIEALLDQVLYSSPNDIFVRMVAHQPYSISVPAFHWFPIKDLRSLDILPVQREGLENSLREAKFTCSICPRTLKDWVNGVAHQYGRRLTGTFTQFRAGTQRMVVEFPTVDSKPLYYLAGTSVLSEARLVRWLESRYYNAAPRTLKLDEPSMQWVIDSVAGTCLAETLSIDRCRRAALALATLQVSLAGVPSQDVESIGRDYRLSTVAARFDVDCRNLVSFHERWRTDLLQELRPGVVSMVRSLVAEAANLGVQDTFVHFDAAPPNLFLDNDTLHLIDFDMAGWGFPFFTLLTFLHSEQLLAHPEWHCDVIRSYMQPWCTTLTERQIGRALEMAEVLRIWKRLQGLLAYSFLTEPERYWKASLYDYLVCGYTKRLLLLCSTGSAGISSAVNGV